jgi:hypothetical protein
MARTLNSRTLDVAPFRVTTFLFPHDIVKKRIGMASQSMQLWVIMY